MARVTRAMKDTTLGVRLPVDRCIAETGRNEATLHPLSAIGGDSEVKRKYDPDGLFFVHNRLNGKDGTMKLDSVPPFSTF